MDSHPETPQWTAARLAAVTPTWEPDVVRARTLSARRRRRARARVMYAAAVATAALIVAFVSPSGRALAQDLWYRWFAAGSRWCGSIYRTSRSIRASARTTKRSAVDSLEEAAAVAGFTPIPAAGRRRCRDRRC